MRDRQLAAAPGRHPHQSQVCAPGDAVLSAKLGLDVFWQLLLSAERLLCAAELVDCNQPASQ